MKPGPATRAQLIRATAFLLLACTPPTLSHAADAHLYPRPTLSFTRVDEADFDNPGPAGGSIGLEEQHLRGHFGFPVYADDNTRFSAHVGLAANELTFVGTDLDPLDLYTIATPLVLDQRLSESWATRLAVTPALAGDYQNLNSDSLSGSAQGLLIHQWPTNGVTLAAGAIFLPALGENRFFPTAGIVWSPSAHWTLSAGVLYVPELGRDDVRPTASVLWMPTEAFAMAVSYPRSWIAYAVSRQVTLYGVVSPSGGRWRVSEAPGVEDGGIVSLRGFRSGAGGALAITDSIRLIAEVGGIWDRDYEAIPDDGDDRTESIGSSWYGTVGVAFGATGEPAPVSSWLDDDLI